MLEDDGEHEIIDRCLSGDGRSFEALVDKYEKIVFNIALRVGGRSEDAEDVTQAVFIKVFENLGSYNRKYKFFSWLYRIALNESINYFRREHATQPLSTEI